MVDNDSGMIDGTQKTEKLDARLRDVHFILLVMGMQEEGLRRRMTGRDLWSRKITLRVMNKTD